MKTEATIEVTVDTTKATEALERLIALAESVPTLESETLEELTWQWPWWMLVAAGAAGGLAVLAVLFIVGTVAGA